MTGEQNNNANELLMEFDPATIEHLGIHQYSTLPPVIAELVANAYDADATEVKIYLNDTGDKEITIEDNGHGMSYDDINPKFLKIGRNRRKTEKSQKSESGKRFVTGKKGIGKLSFFGITSVIDVETVRDSTLNAFRMDLGRLKEASDKNEPYKPEIITKNQEAGKKKGTIIRMRKIKRKSGFDSGEIAYSLTRYFQVFDEPDFDVKIIHNNDKDNPITIENKLKYKGIITEFSWDFPLEKQPKKYKYAEKITGQVISGINTVPSKMNGIVLFSRGKLVNENSFYDVKATSHGYKYLTGWLNVNFIDDWDKEVISTNRKSLKWEDEDCAELKEYLNAVIYNIYNEQRKKREVKKKEEIKKTSGLDIDEWIESLPKHDRKLASKIIGAIIKSEGIDTEKAGTIVGYVTDSFQFESFKELAAEIADMVEINDDTLVKLLKEWELMEAKEFYKISLVRVNAIKTFEKYIKKNAREVPTVHNFFKTFPWLLDPRIMEFKDEVYFSDLLKENFSDSDEELESDKRIDFLCTSIANNRFVIELKRPQHRIREKDIKQTQKYRIFVEEHTGTDQFASGRVVAYVVCGDRNKGNKELEELIELWEGTGKIYIKTYSDLLIQAQKYHSEFIERYEQLQDNITLASIR